ncbi:MAG: hypothetical protein V7606_3620, partial [Burkholderiales bacterium]
MLEDFCVLLLVCGNFFHEAKMNAKKVVSLLPVAFLVACGGGSSGDDTVTVFPIEGAVTTYLTTPRSFTANYTDPQNNDVFVLGYVHTPGADSSFEGNAAKTVNVAVEIKRNGVQVSQSSQVDYFQTSPFRYLGSIDGGGEYSVAANQAALPTTASVGATGNFYTGTSYTNSTKSTVTGTQTTVWSLQRDTPSTALFCTNSTFKSTGNPDLTSSECYKINASGTVIGNRISLSVP